MTHIQIFKTPAGEELRPIPSLPGYYITPDGQPYSRWQRGKHAGQYQVTAFRKLSWWEDQDGYRCMTVRKDGKALRKTLHALVLEAYIGPRPTGHVARHLDDNKNNNHHTNLAWGTPKQNSEDMIRNGHSLRGEKGLRSKLKEKDVKAIRKLFESGESRVVIARKYNVTTGSVWSIGTGKTWKHI